MPDIDPFDTDIYFEYDIREIRKMNLDKAKYLLALLTIARTQVVNFINDIED